MKKSPYTTLFRSLVVFVAVSFVHYAATKIDVRPQSGYTLSATFLKSGGLESGADVRISGIKVGSVVGLELTEGYAAAVKMSVKSSVKLPVDTVASVASDGLMGGKFLLLEPGKAKETLKDGDKIAKTRDFKSLEDIIGEVIFLATGSGDK